MNRRDGAGWWGVLGLVFLAGCAATYKAPDAVARTVSRSIAAQPAAVIRTAQRVLIEQGFQITSASESAGIISTAPRDLRIGPEKANCGTTMGLDYLKDNRTATQVAYGVVVRAGELSVRATIQGNFRIGRFDQDITLTCVSNGVLEDELIGRILAAVER